MAECYYSSQHESIWEPIHQQLLSRPSLCYLRKTDSIRPLDAILNSVYSALIQGTYASQIQAAGRFIVICCVFHLGCPTSKGCSASFVSPFQKTFCMRLCFRRLYIRLHVLATGAP